MKKILFSRVLPYILYVIFNLWCWTLKSRTLQPENEEGAYQIPGRYILTLWHGRIFYLFYHLRRHPDYHLLISPSEDGDMLAHLARLMGYSVIRGSSFKKAVPSARSLIRVLKREERIIIVADGSRGPCQKAQAGSIQIAHMTKTPLIPMSYGAKRRHVFNSWDRFTLPLPFTTCSVNFGTAIPLPTKLDEESLKKTQLELENALNQLTEKADSRDQTA